MSFFHGVVIYLAIGLTVAGLSLFVWRTRCTWFLAYLLFPWHAHERCVGEAASGSICGVCYDAGWPYVAGYALAVTLFWPIKFPVASTISYVAMRGLNWKHG